MSGSIGPLPLVLIWVGGDEEGLGVWQTAPSLGGEGVEGEAGQMGWAWLRETCLGGVRQRKVRDFHKLRDKTKKLNKKKTIFSYHTCTVHIH